MRCPFLQEAQVRSCRASEFRKLIVRTPFPVDELCSTPNHVRCLAAQHRSEERPTGQQCIFLQEMLMQYCSAAPVTKFIPYTESPLSRCGSESHRYCDLYLNLSSPGTKRGAASADGHAEMGEQSLCEYRVDDIRVPSWLAYSANHMWLNIDSDGSCHLGIDDFLAKVLGRVEKLSFLPAKMGGRPSVVLTARGIDLQLMFPNYLVLTASNIGLRANADKLTSDPYTLGWLFEGREAGISPLEPSIAADSGMLRGNQAIAWMESEVARLSEFIRDQTFTPAKTGDRLMTDGGTFIRGLIRHLSRDQVLTLFNEFFSPFAGWRK